MEMQYLQGWLHVSEIGVGDEIHICIGNHVLHEFDIVIKHWYTTRQLERGQSLKITPLSLGIGVALLLGLFGLLTAVYLLGQLDD